MATEPDLVEAPRSPYPCGLRVFFRTINPDNGMLHYSDHLKGRSVEIPDTPLLVLLNVRDKEGLLLGSYLPDAICAILPLETVGPSSDAKN